MCHRINSRSNRSGYKWIKELTVGVDVVDRVTAAVGVWVESGVVAGLGVGALEETELGQLQARREVIERLLKIGVQLLAAVFIGIGLSPARRSLRQPVGIEVGLLDDTVRDWL